VYCVPIFDTDTRSVLAKVKRASMEADIVELRLDLMGEVDLQALLAAATTPVLVTYRTTGEGGRGDADWQFIFLLLGRAMDLGAAYVDVEWMMPRPLREKLMRNRRGSRIMLSRHIREETPKRKELKKLLADMAGADPDVVKIVTTAHSIEDNFRVLELIPKAQEMGIPIIAFAMAAAGRVSRLLCVPMGGFATFGCLDSTESVAPGQLTVRRMRRVTEVLLGED
jgi:3-dehydroquinate dehydratase I